MAKVIYLARRRVRPMGVLIGGKMVDFRLANLDTGEAVLVAEVDDPVVLRALKPLAGLYRVVDSASVSVEPVRGPAEAPPPSDDDALGWSYPPIIQRCLQNGWLYEDLTGAGRENQWGIEGGRNVRNGLTIAEASLSTPPDGWYTGRNADGVVVEGVTFEEDGTTQVQFSRTHYPWEVLGWKPPGLDWKAPVGLPPKRPSALDVPAPLAQPAATIDIDDDPENEGAGTGEPTDPSIERAGEGNDDEEPPPPPTPQTRSAELLAGWTPEQIQQAVGVLETVWRNGGKAPSNSKARHFLKEDGLPPASSAQVQALLDLVQIS